MRAPKHFHQKVEERLRVARKEQARMVWWAAKTALLLDPVNLGGITDRTTITPSLSQAGEIETQRPIHSFTHYILGFRLK